MAMILRSGEDFHTDFGGILQGAADGPYLICRKISNFDSDAMICLAHIEVFMNKSARDDGRSPLCGGEVIIEGDDFTQNVSTEAQEALGLNLIAAIYRHLRENNPQVYFAEGFCFSKWESDE